jgi:hypothetical protein
MKYLAVANDTVNFAVPTWVFGSLLVGLIIAAVTLIGGLIFAKLIAGFMFSEVDSPNLMALVHVCVFYGLVPSLLAGWVWSLNHNWWLAGFACVVTYAFVWVSNCLIANRSRR